MAQVINLNKARKAKAKTQRRRQADENAVKFGRTRAQRDLEAARNAKAERDLDGKKR